MAKKKSKKTPHYIPLPKPKDERARIVDEVRDLTNKASASILKKLQRWCDTRINDLRLEEIDAFMDDEKRCQIGKAPFMLKDFVVNVEGYSKNGLTAPDMEVRFHLGHELNNEFAIQSLFGDLRNKVAISFLGNDARYVEGISNVAHPVAGYYLVKTKRSTVCGYIMNSDGEIYFTAPTTAVNPNKPEDLIRIRICNRAALNVITFVQYCYIFRPKSTGKISEERTVVQDFSKSVAKKSDAESYERLIDLRSKSSVRVYHRQTNEYHRYTNWWLVTEHVRQLKNGSTTTIAAYIKGPGKDSDEARAYFESYKMHSKLKLITIKTDEVN